jgi:hypothetical protein
MIIIKIKLIYPAKDLIALPTADRYGDMALNGSSESYLTGKA